MKHNLQELRKGAGYKSAKSFAEALNIPFTTYARYESRPDKIPLAVAWRLADEFGVTIDIVVGRTEPDPEIARGAIQSRYDKLLPEFKQSLSDYLEYLLAKNSKVASQAFCQESRRIDAICARLDTIFLAELEQQDPEFFIRATAKQLRDRFNNFLEQRSDLCQVMGTENVIDIIMAAYDRTRKPFDFNGISSVYVVVDTDVDRRDSMRIRTNECRSWNNRIME